MVREICLSPVLFWYPLGRQSHMRYIEQGLDEFKVIVLG